jgi:hypothetical protein
VKNLKEVWALYLTAKTFTVRPSELLDVSDRYAAYCLDTAVGEFGRTLEAELKKIEAKTQKEAEVKSDRLIRKWLGLPMQFRDPVKSGHVQLPTKSKEV